MVILQKKEHILVVEMPGHTVAPNPVFLKEDLESLQQWFRSPDKRHWSLWKASKAEIETWGHGTLCMMYPTDQGRREEQGCNDHPYLYWNVRLQKATRSLHSDMLHK